MGRIVIPIYTTITCVVAVCVSLALHQLGAWLFS